ncbi:MAG: DNA/RNA non-specific endonuclease [Desulfobulbaceae bacterium]|nr:DNA/RNA non-specific endonuclease [Desulfobulbaceae bacterium]
MKNQAHQKIPFKSGITILLSCVYFFIFTGILCAGPLEDCDEYTKMGIPGHDGDLLCRTGFLLSHSQENKTPFWVIEHLTAEKAKSNEVQRYNNFKADPYLKKGTRAELSDYKNSDYDRGHMAPSANMKWNSDAMIQCFYLSNMVPQVGKGMNQGIWAQLEGKVRNWAIRRGDLFIFTGPIYLGKEKKTIGSNQVAVPTHLYKIVFDPNADEAIAFIMPNISLDIKDMPNFIVTIRDVEAMTSLDFLSSLDKQRQDGSSSRYVLNPSKFEVPTTTFRKLFGAVVSGYAI